MRKWAGRDLLPKEVAQLLPTIAGTYIENEKVFGPSPEEVPHFPGMTVEGMNE